MQRPSIQPAYTLYESFSATPYGDSLQQKVRYSRYNRAELATQEWQDLLGPDVNNLEHMKYTAELAAFYVGKSPEGVLTVTEAEDLLIAAAIHDQGDAFIGDITYSEKTEADDLEETRLSVQHARLLMPNCDEEVLRRVSDIRENIVGDPNSRIGSIFKTIECLGYLQTALKSFANMKYNPELDDDIREGLTWLTADVLMNMFGGEMQQRASTDPVVARFINNRRQLISEAMSEIDDDVFAFYGDKADEKRTAFLKAKSAWQQFDSKLAA